MDWYCLVFNSGEVSSNVGANYVYERICEGDFSLVGDIDIVNDLHKELMELNLKIDANKGPGFIVIGCNISEAEFISEKVKDLCKKHKLSFFEPQNMEYIF